jgi:thiamine-monophosphate kinase
MAESAEDKLIARFFRPLATHPGALGFADDAAFMTPPAGHDLVLKTDAIVGGVHFFPDDPADAVARKALRVNLSDLAAKGARPAGFLVSLAVPEDVGESWLDAFARGLRADAEAYACPLFGGDTDRTPGPITVAVFAFGFSPTGEMVRRAGAKPGDIVVVTGTIGDAALGVKLRRNPALAQAWKLSPWQRDHLLARYAIPEPRVTASPALRAHASAAMDISDGLAGDFAKLCRVSGVHGIVDVPHVPLSDAARTALAEDPGLVETILTGGDDYEIVATVPPDEFEDFSKMAGVSVTAIGRIEAGQGDATFLDAAGKALAFARPAYSHF